MKKNLVPAVLNLLIMILAGTSCSRTADTVQSAGSQGRSIADTSGIIPARIISAAPSNTEIVIGLGMGEYLIAVDKYSSNIDDVRPGLPLIDFFYPDSEAIIGLEPDLILTNEINSFGVADNPFKLLSDLGISVVEVSTSSSIDGIYTDIMMIAGVLGVKERGEALVNSMKEEIGKIEASGKNMNGQGRKSVYFEVSAIPTMVSFGRGVYLNEMIEIAGGKNIFADQEGWFSPAEEEVINRNPDIIFAMAYSEEDPVSGIMGRRSFEGISAVKRNQIYVIDGDSASRPSQNILLALREMVRAINPAYYETAR